MTDWPRRNRRPWVYGHRGVRSAVPENTLLAFERALASGADGVELDVQLSRDGTPVVFHDSTLDRMTAGADCRAIVEVNADELCSVTLGQGATIPRLRDVLRWGNQRNLYINVELKSEGIDDEALVGAVENEVIEHATDALTSRLLFSSFAERIIRIACRHAWTWPLARLLGPNDVYAADVEVRARVGVHPHVSLLTPSGVASWLPATTFLNTWTVNEPDDARRLAAVGVDGLISDDPAAIRNAIE